MKKIFFSLLIILITYNFVHAAKSGWNVEKSTHFIVYYKNASQVFIKQVIDKSEDYYNRIADDFGLKRFNFWLWDNRAKIYIYDTAKEFQDATSEPSWSGGCAQVKEKTIKSFVSAKNFLETALAHEMGHIIFRELVGFDNAAIPLWLDEGVASYQEKLKYSGSDAIIRSAKSSGKLISLERLSSLGSLRNMDGSAATLFYAESFSIVDFLIKKFGKENFVFFSQNLRDKRNFEKALFASYPFKNTRELGEAWEKNF